MSKLRTILVAVSLLCGSPAALAASWSVEKVTGQASIEVNGATPVSLGGSTEIANGATVITGPSGRVLLVRGKETMVVAPNSSVTIPADDASGFTRILQDAGTVEFDVERKNVKHFEVDTPYLAAIVKGTHFVVTVGVRGAQVSVSRGRVGVSDTRRGGSVDILPGQTAKVSTTASLSVTGVTDKAKAEAATGADAALAPVGAALSPVDSTLTEVGDGLTNTVASAVTSVGTGVTNTVTSTVTTGVSGVTSLLGGNDNSNRGPGNNSGNSGNGNSGNGNGNGGSDGNKNANGNIGSGKNDD